MVSSRLRSFGFGGFACRGDCGVSGRRSGGRLEELGLLRRLARRIGGDDFPRRRRLDAQTRGVNG
jgi:hypothetical protein